jgi:23S rRNA (cytidine1920-2'-O)/16S rRNA (cytidine1409-2'-O)-methyltransferase
LSSKTHRFVALVDRLRNERPEILDPCQAVAAGEVLVDGIIVINPRSLIGRHATITVVGTRALRGTVKLKAEVPVAGKTAMDVGASAGGFTSALLEAGARRVYAVDAGYGQLLGSLRQDERVVNLERTNLGNLTRVVIVDQMDLVVLDLSYLALADAVPQLEALSFGSSAHMIALVKPMYELRLPTPPTRADVLAEAVASATAGVEQGAWIVTGCIRSPIEGRRGAVEFLLCAQRRGAVSSG